MPRGKGLCAASKEVITSPKLTRQGRSVAKQVDMANQNSNHAKEVEYQEVDKNKSIATPAKIRRTRLEQVNEDEESMAIDPENNNKVTFEEDGQQIDMETNDGGQAWEQFASEDEDGENSSEESQYRYGG